MKRLTVDMIDWEIEALPEDMSVRGNAVVSGNDEQDKEIEGDIIEDLENGNEWAWCIAKVTGKYNGIEAVEYLGGCSYNSAEDFETGGYLEDMKDEVMKQIQDMVDRIMADTK